MLGEILFGNRFRVSCSPIIKPNTYSGKRRIKYPLLLWHMLECVHESNQSHSERVQKILNSVIFQISHIRFTSMLSYGSVNSTRQGKSVCIYNHHIDGFVHNEESAPAEKRHLSPFKRTKQIVRMQNIVRHCFPCN